MPFKLVTSSWFPLLLLACCHGKAIRRGSVVNADIDGDFTPCLSEEECRQRFHEQRASSGDAGGGGSFVAGRYRNAAGCFTKNENGYFGTDGTVDEMSTMELSGVKKRLWCDTRDAIDSTAATSSVLGQLELVGNNGLPLNSFPLRKCQGDCYTDSECEGDLVCFQRKGTEAVPGCNTGNARPSDDYCHEKPARNFARDVEVYEAETDAIFDVSTRSSSNGAYLLMGGVDSWIQFNVDLKTDTQGYCYLKFVYSNGGSADKSRPCSAEVNGSFVQTLQFDSTSRWSNWRHESVRAVCAPGENTIRITATTANGGPNLDRIEILAAETASEHTVGVYYYPWHGKDFHRGGGYLRKELEPPHVPTLGEYDDTDPRVIRRHLLWSRSSNINLWVTSWWGPHTREDRTVKNVILPHVDLPGTKVALLYETNNRLERATNVTMDNVYPDVAYMANRYFSDPNYYHIDGRPVLFVYLTRVLAQIGILEEVAALMRQSARDNGGHDLYIVGDHAFGTAPTNGKQYAPFASLDAVTTYDIYGNMGRPNGYAGRKRLNDLDRKNRRWRGAARAGNCSFVPGVSPGYNDRGVRYATDHPALSRKLSATALPGSLFRASLQNALPLTDASTGNLIMINSWNEWHEDTQIEPVIGVAGALEATTQQPLNLTQSLMYEPYGELYLDILWEATKPAFLTSGRGVNWASTLNPTIRPSNNPSVKPTGAPTDPYIKLIPNPVTPSPTTKNPTSEPTPEPSPPPTDYPTSNNQTESSNKPTMPPILSSPKVAWSNQTVGTLASSLTTDYVLPASTSLAIATPSPIIALIFNMTIAITVGQLLSYH